MWPTSKTCGLICGWCLLWWWSGDNDIKFGSCCAAAADNWCKSCDDIGNGYVSVDDNDDEDDEDDDGNACVGDDDDDYNDDEDDDNDDDDDDDDDNDDDDINNDDVSHLKWNKREKLSGQIGKERFLYRGEYRGGEGGLTGGWGVSKELSCHLQFG